MAQAEDAAGKIRRKIKIRGKGFLRLREEPCGEEQAEIIAGKQDRLIPACRRRARTVPDPYADWKKEDSALL